MPKKKKPLTEEDVFGKNPVTKACEKRDITVDELVGNLWDIAKRKEDMKNRKDETEKLHTAGMSRVNTDATVQLCKLQGLYPAEKKDGGGDIIVNINATPIEKEEKE